MTRCGEKLADVVQQANEARPRAPGSGSVRRLAFRGSQALCLWRGGLEWVHPQRSGGAGGLELRQELQALSFAVCKHAHG